MCGKKIILTIPCKYCDGRSDNQLAFYWRQRTLISKGIHSLPAVTRTKWSVHQEVPKRNMTGSNRQDNWQFVELFTGGVTVQLSEVWQVRDGLPSITLDKHIHKSWFIFTESIHRQAASCCPTYICRTSANSNFDRFFWGQRVHEVIDIARIHIINRDNLCIGFLHDITQHSTPHESNTYGWKI